jgi:hypothetical protein
MEREGNSVLLEVSGQLHAPDRFNLEEDTLVASEYEAGRATEQVLMIWRRNRYFASARNQTTFFPGCPDLSVAFT